MTNNRRGNFKAKESKYGKILSRTKWIFSQFFQQRNQYGFEVAGFGLLWWIGFYSRITTLTKWSLRYLTKYIDKYLYDKFQDIINKYKNRQATEGIIIQSEEYPIWVFWWQGETEMPEIVHKCYTLLKKNNKNVVLLSRFNVKEYVDLPASIYDKVAKGEISYTHFSDILRLTLLADYGGMWVDATCFNPYSIPEYAKQQLFYSPHKQNSQDINSTHWCGMGGWRSWNIGTCVKNNPLFLFCKELIIALAVYNNCFPNYLMVDCIICYAYRNFSWVSPMMDTMPDFNLQCDSLLHFFNSNKIYNDDEYKAIIKDNWIFKLSYKTLWSKEINNQQTYYGKLME